MLAPLQGDAAVAEIETAHSFYTQTGVSDAASADPQDEEDLEFLDCDDDSEIMWNLLAATGLPTLAGIGIAVVLIAASVVAILV
jgi:hypothetical protein